MGDRCRNHLRDSVKKWIYMGVSVSGDFVVAEPMNQIVASGISF